MLIEKQMLHIARIEMDASPKGSRNEQDTNADWNTTADAPNKKAATK